MLAAEVIVLVALIMPAVNKLPPVMLAAADTKPAVKTLPPVALPLTVNEVSVPTEVIFGCAAVVTVAAVVALPTVNDAAVPVNPVPAPLNDDPVTVPVADISPAVCKLPPLTLPVTDNETSVPTEVIFV